MASSTEDRPATMKAFQQVAYSTVAKDCVVLATDVPVPEPSAGQMLIRVHSSGMNSGDAMMGRGVARALFNVPFPTTIGRDVAGVVVALPDGSGDTAFKVGDRVVAYVEFGEGRGTFSELCLVDTKFTVALPENVSFVDAAALPTASCTTWQALVGRKILKQGAGQRILVLGGSSATGMAAIQLAKVYGCSQIATTSSQGELCRSLGATTVVNHREGEKWEAALAGGGFDIIYDCAEGLGAWRKCRAVLKPRGAQFVSIVMDHPQDDVRISAMCVFVCRVLWRKAWGALGWPGFVWHINAGSIKGLPELVAMVADGKLTPVLDGAPREPTMGAFTEMWDKQMSTRAHGKLVMKWA
jgi:NADPH:quinone reductase-like Zn-dependent oxidoreductase